MIMPIMKKQLLLTYVPDFLAAFTSRYAEPAGMILQLR